MHASASRYVIPYVTRAALLACVLAVCANAATPNVSGILNGVEKRYNHARTLQVFFEQTYDAPRRAPINETGELFLRKPGRMRWEYASPKGKLFVSDGKLLWLYTPSTNRVERGKVKESDDMRAPLAFLLGKLNFGRDFKSVVLRVINGQTWITASPRKDNLMFRSVQFRVGEDYHIDELIVVDDMNATMHFRFMSEKLNPKLPDNMFTFTPPQGAEVVEAVE